MSTKEREIVTTTMFTETGATVRGSIEMNLDTLKTVTLDVLVEHPNDQRIMVLEVSVRGSERPPLRVTRIPTKRLDELSANPTRARNAGGTLVVSTFIVNVVTTALRQWDAARGKKSYIEQSWTMTSERHFLAIANFGGLSVAGESVT